MLAIVIPYFKISFFEETLKSLSNQTDKRFTVYIGNDASEDNPIKIIDLFKNQIPIKYTFFENNLGAISLTKQWIRCIDTISNEEWIMILGDDDVLGKNVVKDFYFNLSKVNDESTNVIRYATQIIDEYGNQNSNIFQHSNIVNAIDAFYNKINDTDRSSLSEHVFRKSAYQKHQFKNFNLAWHADDLAWLEFSEFKTIFCINSSIVYIRISEKSISGNKSLKLILKKSSLDFYDYLVNNYLFKFTKKQKLLILNHYESCQNLKVGNKTRNLKKMYNLYLKNSSFFQSNKFLFRFLFK